MAEWLAWKRAPFSWQSLRNFGITSRYKGSCWALRSSKVEVTNTRNVRVAAPSMDDKIRNDRLLVHNCIFRWKDLTEVIKDKDREAVRSMPKFLKAAGYEIYIP